MAPVQTIAFLNDRLHGSLALPSIVSATSTAEGNMHNVRDPNFLTYWKSSDASGDQYLRCDAGTSALLCSATNLSPTLTSAGNFINVKVGDLVSGTNIPAGTFVLAKASDSSLTMSQNATGTDVSPVSRTFTHTGWIGDVAQTAYVAIAYDARGADQNTMNLRYYPADDFALATSIVTFTLDKTKPACAWASFTIPSNSNGFAKRRYELVQKDGGSDRPSGEKTAKVYAWAMFGAADIVNLDVDLLDGRGRPGPAAGAYDQRLNAPLRQMPSGLFTSNLLSPQVQPFDLNVDPTFSPLYRSFRDILQLAGGQQRAFFLQYDGLPTPGTPSFMLCRLAGEAHDARRYRVDQYELGLELETEVIPL